MNTPPNYSGSENEAVLTKACTRSAKKWPTVMPESLDRQREGALKIGAKFDTSDWPALRTRLTSGDADAWQDAGSLLRDRIAGRYLAHACELLKRRYSGFAVLAIDCAVVEALEQFRRGEKETPWKKGKEFFRDFLTQTRLGEHFTPAMADLFYETVRCGILHQAETKADTLVKKKKTVQFVVRLSPTGKGLVINAARFHDELKRALDDYEDALVTGDPQLRANFIKKMNHIAHVQPGVAGVV
jgi:hypothetical protein